MKTVLLFTAMLCMSFWTAGAQAPTIEGDTMLCPESTGTATITTDMPYDSYQWYTKPFPDGEFTPITGATSSSLTYNSNAGARYIKVVVTLGEEEYESNILLIDGLTFLPITFSTETSGDAFFDPDTMTYLICDGGAVIQTINMPYTTVQWFKNGVAIPGATSSSLSVSMPGTYHGVGAPEECPGFTDVTLSFVVNFHPDCDERELVNPIIEASALVCPDVDGTISVTNTTEYDTYQWVFKYETDSATFEPIEGADGPEFTFNWTTHNQGLFKLLVTLDGETYQSNTILINNENVQKPIINSVLGEGVTWNEETESYILCEGSGFDNAVADASTVNVQWFKDGEPIEDATGLVYNITEGGTYHVEGASPDCPDTIGTSDSIVVTMQNCTAGLDDVADGNSFAIFPNPANDLLNIKLGQNAVFNSYTIFDVSGKTVASGNISSPDMVVNISVLTQGTYIIKLAGENLQASKVILKK